LERKLESYLTKVYGVTSLGLCAAAVGAHLHLSGHVSGGFLMTLLQIVLLVAIGMTEVSAREYKDGASPLRVGLFFLFAFCIGTNVGSWIELGARTALGKDTISLSDELVYESFVISSVIFGIFTMCGILATSEILFCTLAVCSVGAMITFWTAIASLFGLVSFLTIETVYIRLGLVITSGYILLDTWRILQQARAGFRDVISHSIMLLTDFVQLFVRVLYLLSKSKGSKKSDRR